MEEVEEILGAIAEIDGSHSMEAEMRVKKAEYVEEFWSAVRREYDTPTALSAMDAVREGRYDDAHETLGLEY